MSPLVACYREFAPCAALRAHVRAFFTCAVPPRDAAPSSSLRITREVLFREGDPFWSTLFADGHVSIVFNFGAGYRVDGLWNPDRPRGHVIGPITTARATWYGENLVQIGAYFRAARAQTFTRVPVCELTDRIVPLEDLWGAASAELQSRLRGFGRDDASRDDAIGDRQRISLLESALLRHMAERRGQTGVLDISGLAGSIVARQGQLTVEHLAHRAGVSRQHLTRAFHESVGVTPKLYCRLARFQAGLKYANRSAGDWAWAAAELGYSDQSHMIAEFKEFSGLTPRTISVEQTFHPFMERIAASQPSW